MRTFRFYLFCAWQLILNTLLHISKLNKWEKESNLKEKEEFFVNKIYHNVVQKLLANCGVKLEVTGSENVPLDGPVVFIANHQGNFDVIAAVRSLNRRVGFIVKKELADIPLLGKWMKVMGCKFMDRKDIRQSTLVINDAIEYLKEGNAIFIFPEGTRSRSNNISEFKAGSFKIAIKSGATVVPLTIKDSYKIMEANGGKIKPGTIKIKYHDPIETKNMDKEEAKDLHNKVYEIIKNGMENM